MTLFGGWRAWVRERCAPEKVWTRENSDPRVPLVEFDGDDLIWPPDDDPDRPTTGADPLTAEPGRYAHPLLVEPPSAPTGEDDS